MQPYRSESKFCCQRFCTFGLILSFKLAILFSKQACLKRESVLENFSFQFRLKGNFFISKDRIHMKVPKRWQLNLDSELPGSKIVMYFWGVKNGSECHEVLVLSILSAKNTFFLLSCKTYLKYCNVVHNFMKIRLNLNCVVYR